MPRRAPRGGLSQLPSKRQETRARAGLRTVMRGASGLNVVAIPQRTVPGLPNGGPCGERLKSTDDRAGRTFPQKWLRTCVAMRTIECPDYRFGGLHSFLPERTRNPSAGGTSWIPSCSVGPRADQAAGNTSNLVRRANCRDDPALAVHVATLYRHRNIYRNHCSSQPQHRPKRQQS